MKSERISIFNYEAFYLDHLEGNLGEEDTVLLLAFLENHPELLVDEDDLIVLEPKNEAVVFTEKDSLKIVSDQAVITLSNVEHFLVAEAEREISTEKQTELDAFVANHPHLVKERTYLAAMFLKTDETIVFQDKAGLKRKGALVFWPYVALAAASVLIAFFVVMNSNQEDVKFAKKDVTNKKELPRKDKADQEPEEIQMAKDQLPNEESHQEGKQNFGSNNGRNSVQDRPSSRPVLASVNTMNYQKARGIVNTIDRQNLQPVASKITPVIYSISPEDDMAQVDSPKMKNPIKPITNQLGRTFNTPVDFQTGKAASNSGGGFYLKIGKLEISRNNGKN